jgi:hypothetical protein
MATYPTAVRWSITDHDYELDATTGAHVETHPVDAAVVIRLGFRRGTISGDPATGHTIHEVDTSQDEAVRQADIERRQLSSLGDLVTNGLVSEIVTSHSFANGRLSVRTDYRNTQTGKPGTVTSG